MGRDLKTIVGLILVALILVLAGCITVTLKKKGSGSVNTNQTGYSYDIPILYSGNISAGSIQFEFVCADADIDIVSVSTGQIAGNAMLKYNTYERGRAIIGILDAAGIRGDGELIKINVSAHDNSHPVRLSLENVMIYDANKMEPVLFETNVGSLDPVTGTVVAPSLKYLPEK